MDINKVLLSGLVVSQPVFTKIGDGTPSCTFILQVNETYCNKFGKTKHKSSFIRVESLGKSAHTTAERVLEGQRYIIDGYIRVEEIEGRTEFFIRTYSVRRDNSVDGINYGLGIQAAIEVLHKSMDKSSALLKLEELVKAE